VAIPAYFVKMEFLSRYSIATTADIVVCLIYFIGVALCFCLSAMSEEFFSEFSVPTLD
jgi:adiponectin receptor